MGEFRIGSYDCVGFDMDHTLCRYQLDKFFSMQYSAIVDFLVEQRDYPPTLRRSMSTDVDFLHKGLIFDIERGNFLKLGARGQVLRASHGTTIMTCRQIDSIYHDPQVQLPRCLNDPVCNLNMVSRLPRYWPISLAIWSKVPKAFCTGNSGRSRTTSTCRRPWCRPESSTYSTPKMAAAR